MVEGGIVTVGGIEVDGTSVIVEGIGILLGDIVEGRMVTVGVEVGRISVIV
jgi:hypothetical protein